MLLEVTVLALQPKCPEVQTDLGVLVTSPRTGFSLHFLAQLPQHSVLRWAPLTWTRYIFQHLLGPQLLLCLVIISTTWQNMLQELNFIHVLGQPAPFPNQLLQPGRQNTVMGLASYDSLQELDTGWVLLQPHSEENLGSVRKGSRKFSVWVRVAS